MGGLPILLRQLRTAAGWTGKDFVARLAVACAAQLPPLDAPAEVTYMAWERGTFKPHPSYLRPLAEALGTEVQRLMEAK